MSTNKPYLVIDTRERAVLPFIDDAITDHHYIIKQITVGDFAICKGEQILASIERKTLDDFAASFRDARYENVKKMINLRENTGCKLLFFVEGPAFPSPSRKFCRVPYANILAAMTKLMVRDDIFVIQTENEQHTAKRLADLLRTYETVVDTAVSVADTVVMVAETTPVAADMTPVATVAETAVTVAADTTVIVAAGAQQEFECSAELIDTDVPVTAATVTAATGTAAMAALTERFETTLDECVVSMWMQLKGVSLVMAKVLANKFSIVEFMKIPRGDIKDIKTATGRKMRKEAITSLEALHSGEPKISAKLLSGIKGITNNVAADVIYQLGDNFANVCKASALDISKVEIPQKNRTVKLGLAKANKILESLMYGSTSIE